MCTLHTGPTQINVGVPGCTSREVVIQPPLRKVLAKGACGGGTTVICAVQ